MKNPFILLIGAVILLFILGIKAFWSVLILTIAIALLIFISNYLKKFETGDEDQTSKDYWKYSYDTQKLKKSIWEPKESKIIKNKKIFKDRLVNCYWTLVLIIFYFGCYLFVGIADLMLG
jgi:uncharacterized membrane protein YraQ (UPF0718 family)